MLSKPYFGIDNKGNPLQPPKPKKEVRSLSHEKYDRISKRAFFEPLNKLSSKKFCSPEKKSSKEKESFITFSKKDLNKSFDDYESKPHVTEKKENQLNQKTNQEQTAQNYLKPHNKISEKFTNIYEYRTSQSQSNPSSQMILATNTNKKRNYFEIKPKRVLYRHNPEKIKNFKDKYGRRNYYEGRIQLSKKGQIKEQIFRVFTDKDLGIKKEIQETLQETYLDDDCQTDSEQIKLAINKSKSQVQFSMKRIKREQLISKLIDQCQNESSFFSSQSSYRSENSSSFYGKFSKESQYF